MSYNDDWNAITDFIPFFTKFHLNLVLLHISKNSFRKGSIQAIVPVKDFLKENNIHDYSTQGIGSEDYGVEVPFKLILSSKVFKSTASLYRSKADRGKPKIWFKGIRKYIEPDSILALIYINEELFVINLNDENVKSSLLNEEYVFHQLYSSINLKGVSKELYDKIKVIHDKGFIESKYKGSGSVGETLEYELGIKRNSSKLADYNGIELKAFIYHKTFPLTGVLFNSFPKWEEYPCENKRNFLEKYASGDEGKKLSFNTKIYANKYNMRGFRLNVDYINSKLELIHKDDGVVLGWDLEFLKRRLAEKHSETFWIESEKKVENDVEYFKYNKIIYSSIPNLNLLSSLIMNNIIFVEFSMNIDENNKIVSHSCAFKIRLSDLDKLFSKIEEYDLNLGE